MYNLFSSDIMDEELNGTALKKIIENWVKIKDSFFANDLSGELIRKGIITPDQWIDIKSRPKTDPDKIDEFLCIVQKQKPAAHDDFVKILTEKQFDWNTNLNGASIVRGQCTYLNSNLIKCQPDKQI